MLKVACAVAVVVLALAPGGASASVPPFVIGGGSGLIPLPGFEGQTLQVNVAATRLGGAIHGVHRFAEGGLFGELWGTVDCMRTAGGTALVTGMVVVGTSPGIGLADLKGHRVAVTITDGRPDVFEFDASFLHAGVPPREAIPPCARGAVPVTVTTGGFIVGG
jgi:hypothetical protein